MLFHAHTSKKRLLIADLKLRREHGTECGIRNEMKWNEMYLFFFSEGKWIVQLMIVEIDFMPFYCLRAIIARVCHQWKNYIYYWIFMCVSIEVFSLLYCYDSEQMKKELRSVFIRKIDRLHFWWSTLWICSSCAHRRILNHIHIHIQKDFRYSYRSCEIEFGHNTVGIFKRWLTLTTYRPRTSIKWLGTLFGKFDICRFLDKMQNAIKYLFFLLSSIGSEIVANGKKENEEIWLPKPQIMSRRSWFHKINHMHAYFFECRQFINCQKFMSSISIPMRFGKRNFYFFSADKIWFWVWMLVQKSIFNYFH